MRQLTNNTNTWSDKADEGKSYLHKIDNFGKEKKKEYHTHTRAHTRYTHLPKKP